MLISRDLLQYWQKFIPPPAQLCLIHMMGSDNQFLLRVRHADVHLDLPLTVPMAQGNLQEMLPMQEIGHKLRAMAVMVIPPEWHQKNDYAYCNTEPQILAPELFDPSRFYAY